MQTVNMRSVSGNINTTLQPNKIFPYQSVISVLSVLIAGRDFWTVVNTDDQDQLQDHFSI